MRLRSWFPRPRDKVRISIMREVQWDSDGKAGMLKRGDLPAVSGGQPTDGAVMTLTLLIPTHNRAEVLRETLDQVAGIHREGIRWQVVLILNNCTDDSEQVARVYEGKLPLTLLNELRPGKNAALNRALREIELGDIVVFADDDVSPTLDWLESILMACTEWPDIDVFGGRVDIEWPDGIAPEWAVADWIRAFGYSEHQYAEGPKLYEGTASPFGPNFWVRRSVFEKVPFFDETIGPNPKNRIMGSEASFFMSLQRQGVAMLYYPGARVRHRIHEKECRLPALRRRGYTFGRGQVRLHGWRRANLYARHKLLWAAAMVADTGRAAVRYGVGRLLPERRRNCEMTVSAMIDFGSIKETLDGWRQNQPGKVPPKAANATPTAP